MAIYYNSPTVQLIDVTPETLAKQYVDDMKFYKKCMHQQRINDMIRKFAYTYHMKCCISTVLTPFKPKLPTPVDRVKYVYVGETNCYDTTSANDYSTTNIWYSNMPW